MFVCVNVISETTDWVLMTFCNEDISKLLLILNNYVLLKK
jgi:hypothetical protein